MIYRKAKSIPIHPSDTANIIQVPSCILEDIEDEEKKAFLMEKRDEIEAFMKTAPTVLA